MRPRSLWIQIGRRHKEAWKPVDADRLALCEVLGPVDTDRLAPYEAWEPTDTDRLAPWEAWEPVDTDRQAPCEAWEPADRHEHCLHVHDLYTVHQQFMYS
jgi:hypothetical protein